VLAAEGPAGRVSGSVVNCGAGQRISLVDVIKLIEEMTGRRVAVERRPPREGDVRDSQAGLQRAQDVLGYTPQVSLAEGLRKTWTWIQTTASAPDAAPALFDAG
ncbi:MAG: hypothetical protein ACT4P6_21195, partial [Gemmatimonadaceae bacterium]